MSLKISLKISALFNSTSLKYPDFNTDFNRLVANMLMYKSSSLAEHWDEIGDRIMKMYFPSGRINDHSHSNVVDVCNIFNIYIRCEIEPYKSLCSFVFIN